MELHAPTAGTSVLQHRSGSSRSHYGSHLFYNMDQGSPHSSSHRNIGAHLATQMELHALHCGSHPSCNTDQDSSHSHSTPQYGHISCNTDGISRFHCGSHSSCNIDQDSFHSISPSQYRHILQTGISSHPS